VIALRRQLLRDPTRCDRSTFAVCSAAYSSRGSNVSVFAPPITAEARSRVAVVLTRFLLCGAERVMIALYTGIVVVSLSLRSFGIWLHYR